MQANLALSYDPATRKADLVFQNGGLVLDYTAATPAIVSLLCDRRARPDDTLPLPEAPVLEPDELSPRRGWSGDALDREGRRIGSRLWLLSRAKETEETRRRAARYAREALAWAEPLGLAVDAAWIRVGVLAYSCRVGRDEIVIEQPVS